jgi:hypothetical protein
LSARDRRGFRIGIVVTVSSLVIEGEPRWFQYACARQSGYC